MLKPRWMLPIGLLVLGAGTTIAQDYPTRTVRVVTGEPGGTNDFIARLLAQGLAKGLGQNVIVENRPSNLIGEVVAKAPADGYTLLVAGATFVTVPLLQKTSYDPVKDFAPITLATTSPAIMVVHPSLPVKSVKELIAFAKARPGELNYSSSPGQQMGELFNTMAGIKIVRIPYKGGGPAINALIGGEVQLMFATAAAATPHIKSGRLRALAVTTPQPSALGPGLPTVTSTLPGFVSQNIYGIFAPVKTPETIIRRVNREAVQFLNVPATKELLLANGVEAIGSTPEELADTVKSEMARLAKLNKDAGVRTER